MIVLFVATGDIGCEQALHLGEFQEVTVEQHKKGDVSARRVLSPPSSPTIHRELAGRLHATRFSTLILQKGLISTFIFQQN